MIQGVRRERERSKKRRENVWKKSVLRKKHRGFLELKIADSSQELKG